MPQSWTKTEAEGGKAKASGGKREWPPKVAGAVKEAPEHLFLMPWYRQLPWLTPAAAHALREKVEARALEVRRGREARGEIRREVQSNRRG